MNKSRSGNRPVAVRLEHSAEKYRIQAVINDRSVRLARTRIGLILPAEFSSLDITSLQSYRNSENPMTVLYESLRREREANVRE